MSGLERIAYADGASALTGWLARPAGKARAAILVWPTIMNVTPAIERRAQMLADEGYLAFIADFYGGPIADFAEAGKQAEMLRRDVNTFRRRLFAGLEALCALPEARGLPVATTGYCMGGMAVLELARAGADLVAGVTFHGVFETQRPAQSGMIKPRLLICHGDADPLVQRDKVIALWQELDAAGVHWHFHSYSGVLHGFSDPGSDARGLPAIGYNASADRQSWAAMLSLFDEVFGNA